MSGFNFFEYNGKRSIDFNIFIQDKNIYSKPARSVEEKQIPGRNGNVIADNGNYSNRELRFDCVMIVDSETGASAQMNAVRRWLCEKPATYKKLKTTFTPGYTMMAVFVSEISVTETDASTQPFEYALFFSLVFSAKPQMYIDDFLNSRTITSDEFEVFNPTPNTAEIKLDIGFETSVGIGFKLTLINSYGTQIFTISSVRGATYLVSDAEMHTIYTDSADVVINGWSITQNCECNYPLLRPGNNTFKIENTMSGAKFNRVLITERFWDI